MDYNWIRGSSSASDGCLSAASGRRAWNDSCNLVVGYNPIHWNGGGCRLSGCTYCTHRLLAMHYRLRTLVALTAVMPPLGHFLVFANPRHSLLDRHYSSDFCDLLSDGSFALIPSYAD